MAGNGRDREVLRGLAEQVREIAELPVMEERRGLWRRHNSLDPVRPMILVFPEGSWAELLPRSMLKCEDEGARGIEWELRRRIYHHEHIHDDAPIEKEWVVHKVIGNSGWGLEPRHIDSTEARGAWAFDPVLNSRADLQKLHAPEITCDEDATQRNLASARDLFGDILDVTLKGVGNVSFHMMAQFCRLRGLRHSWKSRRSL